MISDQRLCLFGTILIIILDNTYCNVTLIDSSPVQYTIHTKVLLRQINSQQQKSGLTLYSTTAHILLTASFLFISYPIQIQGIFSNDGFFIEMCQLLWPPFIVYLSHLEPQTLTKDPAFKRKRSWMDPKVL